MGKNRKFHPVEAVVFHINDEIACAKQSHRDHLDADSEYHHYRSVITSDPALAECHNLREADDLAEMFDSEACFDAGDVLTRKTRLALIAILIITLMVPIVLLWVYPPYWVETTWDNWYKFAVVLFIGTGGITLAEKYVYNWICKATIAHRIRRLNRWKRKAMKAAYISPEAYQRFLDRQNLYRLSCVEYD